MSDYRMQVFHIPSNTIVSWKPGADLEVDFIDDLCERLKLRGVGMFTSEAKVLAAVRESLADVVFDLKKKVK